MNAAQYLATATVVSLTPCRYGNTFISIDFMTPDGEEHNMNLRYYGGTEKFINGRFSHPNGNYSNATIERACKVATRLLRDGKAPDCIYRELSHSYAIAMEV